MNTGKAIRTIRTNLGLSQSEFAEKCGITQTSLSQIETGRKRPNSGTIKKICSSLDITEGMLMVLGLDYSDAPKENKGKYDMLYPHIVSMVLDIMKK